MNVTFALFADAANISQEGKLNILGIFDAVHVGQLPSLHPRGTLVLRIKASPTDQGVHQLALQWTNPRGVELWNSQAQLEIGKGATVDQVSRKLGITEQTYYRWKREYGGMEVDQLAKLKELERENGRLKKIVAEQAMNIDALKEIASKKW